jgi:predicted nucleic acid-binding protein
LIHYLDSSFIISVILRDPRIADLEKKLNGSLFTSRLGQTEVIRSLNKFNPENLGAAREFLKNLGVIPIDEEILRRVESYPLEITLKTADAIHMATAEALLDQGDSLVTLDKQMASNAALMGIAVLSS